MGSIIYRVWNSPTITSWASIASRTLTILVLLPQVLKLFTPAEVAFWQTLALLSTLQVMIDFGFGTTFARFFAYAFGGADSLQIVDSNESANLAKSPNLELLSRILATTRWLYNIMALAMVPLLGIGGSVALAVRIRSLDAEAQFYASGSTGIDGIVAWALVLITTCGSLSTNGYIAFLQGVNQVALLRRWEALFAIAGLLSAMAVLAFGGRLLALVFVQQAWVFASLLRNRWLAWNTLRSLGKVMPRQRRDREVMATTWPAVWRTGVGFLTMFGVVQVSGLLVAQIRDSQVVGAYLLGLRIVQTLSTLSQAPFYSKLPKLGQLWVQGNRNGAVRLATRGFGLAYWTFVVPAIGLGLLGPVALDWLDASTRFPVPELWWAMVWAYFGERYGAMHLQICALAGRIIAHIANTGAGIAFGLVSLIAWPRVGLLAFPLAMIVGNCGFYSWFCARLSYRIMAIPPLTTEARLAIPPATILLVVTLLDCVLHR